MDREGLVASDRVALVGVISLDNRPLAGGAHIVEQLDEAIAARLDRPHQLGLLFAGARQIYRRWRWSRAASRGTARACSSPTRCASASGRSRSSAIISSTRTGAACMVEPLSPARTGLEARRPRQGARRRRRRARGDAAGLDRPGRRLPRRGTHADGRDQRRDRTCPAGRRRRRRRRRRQVGLRHRARTLPRGRPERRSWHHAQGGGARRHRHHHRPVAWPHGDPHLRPESRMGAGQILRHRLCAGRVPGRRRPLDRPSRYLRADPAHRRRSNSTSTSSARSRARSGQALCHASEEVGYEVR